MERSNATGNMRATATEIVRRLQDAGFAAFWVGGCVRDLLLGRSPGDYDIVTAALPEQIERLFRRTIPVGRQFGVVVVVEDAFQFQVATFRAEGEYRDGRHPDRVTFGDARADVLRRDFTVNGLLYDPVTDQARDWVGGEADLRSRIIRTIGPPDERFAEDHLRLLRAVRFAVQLGFDIDPDTFDALRRHAHTIRAISAERIRDELIRTFRPNTAPDPGAAPHPGQPAARGLDLLRDSGLLEVILPELAATAQCEQSPDYHPEGSVFNHLRLMLRQMPADAHPSLPWAVLLHDIAKPVTASRNPVTGAIHFYEHEKVGAVMAEKILERLRFPRKQIDEIVQAVRCHMQFKDVPHMRKSTVRRLLLRPTFPLELELHRLDCLGSHGRLDIHQHLVEQAADLGRRPEIVPALVTGDDLMTLGMQPGPALGAMLGEIREKQLQDELRTPDDARAWAAQRIELDQQKSPA